MAVAEKKMTTRALAAPYVREWIEKNGQPATDGASLGEVMTFVEKRLGLYFGSNTFESEQHFEIIADMVIEIMREGMDAIKEDEARHDEALARVRPKRRK